MVRSRHGAGRLAGVWMIRVEGFEGRESVPRENESEVSVGRVGLAQEVEGG